MMKWIMKRFTPFLMLLLVVLQVGLMPVYAAGDDESRLWLRAKLTYEFDDGLTGVDDSMVHLSSPESWSKRDDWYYYKTPVESGQVVRFMDGVNIPESWGSEAAGKSFKIIVHVQISEVPAGEVSWKQNGEVAYAQTFQLWNEEQTKKNGNVTIKEGDISVTLKEYQLDENGEMVDYVNDKLVTPGQLVSKIVEFTVNGRKTTVTPPPEEPEKPDKPKEPDKPKTPTPETPKTETPKTETPKTEQPKTETPKTETPKTETPVTTQTPVEEKPANPIQQIIQLLSRQTGDNSKLPLFAKLCLLGCLCGFVIWKTQNKDEKSKDGKGKEGTSTDIDTSDLSGLFPADEDEIIDSIDSMSYSNTSEN